MTTIAQERLPTSRRSRARLRAWGVVGVVAQMVFTVGWLLADRWQGPGYSAVRHTISDETALTAPHARYLISCQLICGVGTIAFALFGLRPALAGAGAVRRAAPGCWQSAVCPIWWCSRASRAGLRTPRARSTTISIVRAA